MSDSSRQMGEGEDLHSQRTAFMPAGQMEQSEDSERTRLDPQNDAHQAQQNQSEDHGTLEPRDSRNVTGASGAAGVGAPGGSDQGTGGERWGGGQQGQTETPDAAGGSQQQAEEVEFEADPAIEPAGEDVEFESAEGQQSQATGDMRQTAGGQSMAQMEQSAGASQFGESLPGENVAADQMSQYDGGGGQMGGGGDTGSRLASQIREHMTVIGADGVKLGTVDGVEGGRIKLTKADSGPEIEGAKGSHQGHHHFVSCGLVADIEGETVRLSATAANAYAMLEEE